MMNVDRRVDAIMRRIMVRSLQQSIRVRAPKYYWRRLYSILWAACPAARSKKSCFARLLLLISSTLIIVNYFPRPLLASFFFLFLSIHHSTRVEKWWRNRCARVCTYILTDLLHKFFLGITRNILLGKQWLLLTIHRTTGRCPARALLQNEPP